MGKFPEEVELTKDSLAIDLILKHSSHLLDGYFLASRLVDGTADGTVATLAEDLDALVAGADLPISKLVQLQTLSLHLYFFI